MIYNLAARSSIRSKPLYSIYKRIIVLYEVIYARKKAIEKHYKKSLTKLLKIPIFFKKKTTGRDGANMNFRYSSIEYGRTPDRYYRLFLVTDLRSSG